MSGSDIERPDGPSLLYISRDGTCYVLSSDRDAPEHPVSRLNLLERALLWALLEYARERLDELPRATPTRGIRHE